MLNTIKRIIRAADALELRKEFPSVHRAAEIGGVEPMMNTTYTMTGRSAIVNERCNRTVHSQQFNRSTRAVLVHKVAVNSLLERVHWLALQQHTRE